MKYPTYQEIQKLIDEKYKLDDNTNNDIDFIVGISRGGLIPAAMIATNINKPLVTAYIDKEDNVYFDKPEWIKDKNVLLVDDICRSGKTLKKIRTLLNETTEVKKIKMQVLFITGDSLISDIEVECFEKSLNEEIIFPWDRS